MSTAHVFTKVKFSTPSPAFVNQSSAENSNRPPVRRSSRCPKPRQSKDIIYYASARTSMQTENHIENLSLKDPEKSPPTKKLKLECSRSPSPKPPNAPIDCETPFSFSGSPLTPTENLGYIELTHYRDPTSPIASPKASYHAASDGDAVHTKPEDSNTTSIASEVSRKRKRSPSPKPPNAPIDCETPFSFSGSDLSSPPPDAESDCSSHDISYHDIINLTSPAASPKASYHAASDGDAVHTKPEDSNATDSQAIGPMPTQNSPETPTPKTSQEKEKTTRSHSPSSPTEVSAKLMADPEDSDHAVDSQSIGYSQQKQPSPPNSQTITSMTFGPFRIEPDTESDCSSPKADPPSPASRPETPDNPARDQSPVHSQQGYTSAPNSQCIQSIIEAMSRMTICQEPNENQTYQSSIFVELYTTLNPHAIEETIEIDDDMRETIFYLENPHQKPSQENHNSMPIFPGKIIENSLEDQNVYANSIQSILKAT